MQRQHGCRPAISQDLVPTAVASIRRIPSLGHAADWHPGATHARSATVRCSSTTSRSTADQLTLCAPASTTDAALSSRLLDGCACTSSTHPASYSLTNYSAGKRRVNASIADRRVVSAQRSLDSHASHTLIAASGESENRDFRRHDRARDCPTTVHRRRRQAAALAIRRPAADSAFTRSDGNTQRSQLIMRL